MTVATSTRRAEAAHLTTIVSTASREAKGYRSRRWRWAAATIAVLALVLYRGGQRQPIGPASGAAWSGPTPIHGDIARDTLRVGTFNIHGGKGTDGVRDLGRIADVLRDLDFVGLNEVHGSTLMRYDQAADLGSMLSVGWLSAPTEQRWWHDRFGNGALSRLPVQSWQCIPLARVHGKSFRNAVLVRATHRGRLLNLVVTHIDRSDDRERKEQLRTVGELFLALSEPAILMGDMNTYGDEPALRRLLESPEVRDPLRDALKDIVPRRIDWILVRGMRTIDAGFVQNGASDHPHVWAELAWPSTTAPQTAESAESHYLPARTAPSAIH